MVKFMNKLFWFCFILEVLAIAVEKQEIRGILTEEEKLRLSPFAGDTTIYV